MTRAGKDAQRADALVPASVPSWDFSPNLHLDLWSLDGTFPGGTQRKRRSYSWSKVLVPAEPLLRCTGGEAMHGRDPTPLGYGQALSASHSSANTCQAHMDGSSTSHRPHSLLVHSDILPLPCNWTGLRTKVTETSTWYADCQLKFIDFFSCNSGIQLTDIYKTA